MNTLDFINIAAAICPDRDSLVFEGKRRSYAQTCDRITRLSGALAGLGMQKGNRIASLQVNCPQVVELYFAVASLGGIFVPLNFRAKNEELTYMIQNAEAKFLFFGQRYLDSAKSIAKACPELKECVCIDAEETGFLSYRWLLASEPTNEASCDIDDEDVTILMYTSGTTGRPKAVPLTHSAFASYVLNNVEPANPDIEEKNLISVPLYHIAGVQNMMASIYGGRTIVMMPQFEAKEWLEIVQREQVNRAMLVPTMLKTIIEYPDFAKYDLSSLKVVTYGAARMPFEVIVKAIKMMPKVKFFNAFGQTETTAAIAALGPEDHVIEGSEEEKQKKLNRLASSIGKPLPGICIKILDEDGKELPCKCIGEIAVQGSQVMKGYWHDEGASRTFTSQGWLLTKDMGWIDEEGYVYLTGRADDVIKRGGEKLSPEEIEDVLRTHPKIELAAVIGVPDAQWGEQPRAIVVLKKGESPTKTEIIEYCREKIGFKRPRSVIFVDCLPLNSMGKVLRKKLREQYGAP